MKPRAKAFSLAVLASLGLMGGCKKENGKVENPNVEVTATMEATPEPTEIVTPTPTAVPTEVPTPEPTPEPTPTPTPEPTPEPTPVDTRPRISLMGEIDESALEKNEEIIIEPYVQWFIWSGQNAKNVKLEDGWTNSNIFIPNMPNYGYCGFALDSDGNYIWILTNLNTITKKYDPENDFFTQDIILDEETKTYETLNRMVSLSPGQLYENSHQFDEYEEMYGQNFYEPYEHLIYYVCDVNEMFDEKGNLIVEIPDGYDCIVASEFPDTGKAVMLLTNWALILVEEDVKLPGKVIEKENTLTLHL